MRRTLQRTAPRPCFLAFAALAIALGCLAGHVQAEPVDWDSLSITKFSAMQAVDANGYYSWSMPTNTDSDSGAAYVLRGIVLNNPSDMLDSTAGASPWMGGQWQVYVQAFNDATDSGGAALWMGQYLGNIKGGSANNYSDADWAAELDRLNYPTYASGITDFSQLRAGDVIEVRARGGLFYGGKYNVNEEHWSDPAYDFEIVILQRDQTIDVTDLALSTIKDTSDEYYVNTGAADITDLTDLANPEHYQSTMVRLTDVSLDDDSGWGNNGYVTVSDDEGRTFTLHLGINGFDSAAAPTLGTLFDVVGIFNQEDTDDSYYNDGYQLWVMDASQFGGLAAVPEPGTIVLLGTGLLALWALRRRRNR